MKETAKADYREKLSKQDSEMERNPLAEKQHHKDCIFLRGACDCNCDKLMSNQAKAKRICKFCDKVLSDADHSDDACNYCYDTFNQADYKGRGQAVSNTAKATARPWQLNGFFIESYGGPDIAEVGISNEHGQMDQDEAEANASLIVKAVNGWDNVESLKARIKELEA